MTWRSPSWLILGVPLLATAAFLLWRSKAPAPKGKSFLRLVPEEGRWAIRSGPRVFRRRPWLLILSGLLSILALAGPQWGQSPRQLLRPSSDVILALDLSRSMTTPDLTPSRLDRAKLLIRTFLQEAAGQRIGLLVFSNSAQLAVPLTTDYRALEELLGELGSASLPEAGTDFSAFLEEACDAFSQSDAARRILLVLSDGEDHGNGWKERLPRLIREGVRVYAIGLGTDRGGLIPDPKGGFLKDEAGHPVLSHLQPEGLRALASATGGQYFRGDRWVSLSDIFGFDATADPSRLERTFGRTERFAYFLLPAVLCWSASLLLELPAFRSSPRVRSPLRPAASGSKLRLALLLGLAGLLTLLCSTPAHCGPATASGREAEDPLVRSVQALVRKDRLSASDYGTLARETISWCQSRREQGLSTGVISDGLAAVDQGERLDPRLFPWEQLRKELRALLESAHPRDAAPEGSSPSSENQGDSSPKLSRFRPWPTGRPVRPEGNGRPRPLPGGSAGKRQTSPPSSTAASSLPKDGEEPQARPAPSEPRNGARARLRQVERLDRPALLFERMRQKEAEQVDAPPDTMDW
ncbi:VWA domain-containing protein [Methylacidimicrobium sp. B4]|uniref:VWA domain-containing protein n=1 Tax=Methylacidimicrobium sp. B4 TaxID=2796139 RepID=UPI001A905F64|nr:VWA domain-containing protein [Methylacidimicrobium sp. B4]QSR84061.1 VWA domain-containing protein [Methylacidimicrobium sp. B4]